MTRLLLIGCAWLMVACGAAGNEAERIAAEADVYLRAKTQAGAFSGTVLLARGGKVLFVKGYGFANEEWCIPNDADTRFPIASVTKTFTAALVMKLRQQGRLALEDPLCKFLAPCPESWRAITLRHLLLQTTGIPDYARDRDFIAKVRQRQSLPELIGVFRDRPLEFTPGARHAYSNSNYILLGAVLEEASGRSYEALCASTSSSHWECATAAWMTPRWCLQNAPVDIRPRARAGCTPSSSTAPGCMPQAESIQPWVTCSSGSARCSQGPCCRKKRSHRCGRRNMAAMVSDGSCWRPRPNG
jgi:hypothetical protein